MDEKLKKHFADSGNKMGFMFLKRIVLFLKGGNRGGKLNENFKTMTVSFFRSGRNLDPVFQMPKTVWAGIPIIFL